MTLTSVIEDFFRRQKWIMFPIFVLSLILTIASIVFCRIRGFSGMENAYSFNLGADVVSMAICTVLLYSLAQDRECYNEHTRTFALLISSTSFVLFTDACCWIVQGIKELRVWNITANVLNYSASLLLIFFLWKYVFTALELRGRFFDISSMIMNSLLLPAVAACLINIFVPLYFSVDSEGVYCREPLFIWSQTYLAVGLVIVVIGFFLSRAALKEKLITASFVLIPVANQLITGYSFGLSTEFSAMLISIVLVFGVVVAKREQAMIAMEKELYEAKVSVMVSQIRPHFMYNALTSIAMMCQIDPATAQEATVTFAKYLRGNMDSLKQTKPIPFGQELEHLKKYLYIEKLRFGKKLNIEYDIQTEDFVLPQLSIQPLVENAVKHGVGMKKKGGTVKISARETENAFEVVISDDGVGFDTSAEIKDDGRSHVGMENTKRRLREMCGGEIRIESVVGEGTVVTVILPKEGQKNEDIVS